MALLREEIKQRLGDHSVYDVIVEEAADLAGLVHTATGSMAYVLEDGKLYIKKTDASWAEVE